MILAHGPWYGEWHHLPDLFRFGPMLLPFLYALWARLRS